MPSNHTLPLRLTVDFLANRRYRHECGGLFLHCLLVGPFTQKTVLYTISLCMYLISPDILSLVGELLSVYGCG